MVTGFTHYKGFRAAQHGNFTAVFEKFLNEQKFDTIIEIGTLNGGLTRFLKDAAPTARLVSYDITNQPEHPDLVACGVELKIKNIFGDGYRVADPEAIQILNSEGKKLILCDGGNKAAEFNSMAGFMRRGDFIMAHDYSYDENTYKNHIYDKVWNWFEISENDISSTSSANGLVHYNQQEFQGIVWVCKTKI